MTVPGSVMLSAAAAASQIGEELAELYTVNNPVSTSRGWKLDEQNEPSPWKVLPGNWRSEKAD